MLFFPYSVLYVVAMEMKVCIMYFAIFKLPYPCCTHSVLYILGLSCRGNGCYGHPLHCCRLHPFRRGLSSPFRPGAATFKASYLINVWIKWHVAKWEHLKKIYFFIWENKINNFAVSVFHNLGRKLSEEKIEIIFWAPRVKISIFPHNS